MNATKRKFNTLLQGLGSPGSSHESPPSESSPNPLRRTSELHIAPKLIPGERQGKKRPRIDSDTPKTLLPASTLSQERRISSTTKDQRSPTTVHVRSEAPAKFCPSDRQELLKRLATFQELTDWSPKPDRVSEIDWAKRGWICRGRDTVRCLLCHKEAVVKFTRKDPNGCNTAVLVPAEVEESLIDKYATFVVTAHHDECLWRKRGCDDSLIRIPLANPEASLRALRSRYDELCSRAESLPYWPDLRLPEILKLEEVIQALSLSFFDETLANRGSTDHLSFNKVALAMALTGWQGLHHPKLGSVLNSASCGTCLRRLGLWIFRSKEIDEFGSVIVPAPMDHLDPVREHRLFCPWRNGQVQSRNPSGLDLANQLSGWEELLRTIGNDAHLRKVYRGPSSFGRKENPVQTYEPHCLDSSLALVAMEPRSAEGPLNACVEGDAAQEAKDKERWARLRRVKSLFETKGSKSRARPTNRPGTSHSKRSEKEHE